MKICFIGGGNMASALIAGLVGKLAAGPDVLVVDPNAEALQRLNGRYGVQVAPTIGAAVAACELVVLAVKPQQMRDVATALRAVLGQARPLVLSIAAGIRGTDLARWLGGYDAIVRSMPNTPALIGMGITGMVAMPGVSDTQKAAADSVMRAVGQTVWLDDEAQIDPVTAVSGSGPAYVFYFIEAMQQAALELGLSAQQGRELALATFTGAAQLAAQSDESVEVLRQRVTSKGGTTHAAITSMEQAGVKQAIVDAVKAAAARGRELGEELGND
jgi:pyrroline-5-carboxylate reductase